MIISKDALSLVLEFASKETIDAVNNFASSDALDENGISLVGAMLGCSKADTATLISAQETLKISFTKNFKLLIQKTWVEDTDATTKAEILYSLENLFASEDWCVIYKNFLKIIYKAIFLMFGEQTHGEDFCEYTLRIDPEFGLFWWYIQSLPQEPAWSTEKCHIAVLLGMHFLANY